MLELETTLNLDSISSWKPAAGTATKKSPMHECLWRGNPCTTPLCAEVRFAIIDGKHNGSLELVVHRRLHQDLNPQ